MKISLDRQMKIKKKKHYKFRDGWVRTERAWFLPEGENSEVRMGADFPLYVFFIFRNMK